MPLITRTKNSLCFNFPAVLAEGSLGQTLLCSWNSSVGRDLVWTSEDSECLNSHGWEGGWLGQGPRGQTERVAAVTGDCSLSQPSPCALTSEAFPLTLLSYQSSISSLRSGQHWG